jgi:phosphotransferase system HPr (HPr) family protein
VRVVGREGLHARPCAEISRIVRRSHAKVSIVGSRGEADATSVLELMTLGLSEGHEAEIVASGPDAARVLDLLVALFARGFDEKH